MSVELLGNIIAKRLSASTSLSAAADAQSKQRLISFSQSLSRHPDTCGILNRAGLAERAVDLAAAGDRFDLSDVNEALKRMPLLQGTAGDTADRQSKMAFKMSLQHLGLL